MTGSLGHGLLGCATGLRESKAAILRLDGLKSGRELTRSLWRHEGALFGRLWRQGWSRFIESRQLSPSNRKPGLYYAGERRSESSGVPRRLRGSGI